MSCKFENLEKNKVKITFSVSAEKLEEGIKKAYAKNKGKINLPGFRKGKVPRKMIEAQYGKGFFFEDAINIVMPEAYANAVKELELNIVSRPEIKVQNISVEEGATIFAECYIKPEVTITAEDYKGVTYEKQNADVTDDDVEAEINKIREQNSRIVHITDRAVKDGDIITLNFEGFVEGVAFEGGKAEDYDLVIGSKTFVDTFEEQLIGAEIEQELDVNVTFPENYGKEELQNKKALFKVKIKDIKVKELPEANDEFAKDVSEFDTLEEYRNDVKEQLGKSKENDLERKKEDQVLNGLIERATMEVPQVMIENQIDNMINDFANQIRMQGMSLDIYLKYMGQTMDSLREAYRKNADTQVKARLVLEKIVELENIEANEEDFNQEIDRIAKGYSMEKDKLLEVLREEDKIGLKSDLKVKSALKFIIDNSVEA